MSYGYGNRSRCQWGGRDSAEGSDERWGRGGWRGQGCSLSSVSYQNSPREPRDDQGAPRGRQIGLCFGTPREGGRGRKKNNKREKWIFHTGSFNQKDTKPVNDRDLDFLFQDTVRDSSLDQELKSDLQKKKTDPKYLEMRELVDLIKSNQVVVVSRETGCGKTTQVTQLILDDYIEKQMGSLCRIVCTQPLSQSLPFL